MMMGSKKKSQVVVVDLKNTCLFCFNRVEVVGVGELDKRGGEGDGDGGSDRNLVEVPPEEPKFSTLCKYLKIKLEEGTKTKFSSNTNKSFQNSIISSPSSSSSSCYRILCSGCFRMLEEVHRLRLKVKEMKRLIAEQTFQIQRAILDHGLGNLCGGVGNSTTWRKEVEERLSREETCGDGDKRLRRTRGSVKKEHVGIEFISVFQNLVRDAVMSSKRGRKMMREEFENHSHSSSSTTAEENDAPTTNHHQDYQEDHLLPSKYSKVEKEEDDDDGIKQQESYFLEPEDLVEGSEDELDYFGGALTLMNSLENSISNGDEDKHVIVNHFDDRDDVDDDSDSDWRPDKLEATDGNSEIIEDELGWGKSNKEEGQGQEGFSERCIVCSEVFNSPTDYTKHLCRHHSDFDISTSLGIPTSYADARAHTNEPQQPDSSSSSFLNSNSKRRRVFRTCTICKFTARSGGLRGFRDHLLSHEEEDSDNKGFGCSMCDSKFQLELNLAFHVLFAHAKFRRQAICLKCDQCGPSGSTFRSQTSLVSHIARSHNAQRAYSCKSCEWSFSTLERLLGHLHRHFRSKRLGCPDCDFFGVSFKELADHCQSLHKNLNFGFPCPICPNKSFSTPTGLKTHVQRAHHHPSTSTAAEVAFTEGSPSPPSQSHVCPHCSRAYKTSFSLSNHLRIDHGPKEFQCTYCPKSFAFKSLLQQHVDVKHEVLLHQCPYCEKCLKTKRQLEVHIRAHTGEGKISCELCGKELYSEKHMRQHMSRNHDLAASVCTLCGKEFRGAYRLQIHMRNVHYEKKHKCCWCGKAFAKGDALKNHVRTHTGERPFVCPVCSKDFNQAGILKVHMIMHNKKNKIITKVS